MGFQKKLLITYTLSILFLTFFLSVLFFQYSSGLFETNALAEYSRLSASLNRQLDNLIETMDLVSDNLLSDSEFLTALTVLDTLSRDDLSNNQYINEAKIYVSGLLANYSLIKNFYAVSVYNEHGDFFSSNYNEHFDLKDPAESYLKWSWIEESQNNPYRIVSIKPQPDIGNKLNPPQVFGRGRVVSGLNEGIFYITVLKKIKELESILVLPDKQFSKILLYNPTGDLFYSSQLLSDDLFQYYRDFSESSPKTGRFISNSLSGRREAVFSTSSEITGMKVILILDRQILLSPLRNISYITLIIGFLIIIVSIGFIWLSSLMITRPLRLIQLKIEDTMLSNLTSGEPINHANNEIVALDRAFQTMQMRLDESIREELDSRTLWMRARFDSLQAQINPHFINNILTVIAARGVKSGDEGIAELCDAVASILRYSTDTIESDSTIGDEIEHLRTYLYLMKQRLQKRLTYNVSIDPELIKTAFPKMILQPFVENSFSHGYNNSFGPIDISIKGKIDGERWILEIGDNGEGFDPDKLKEIRNDMNQIRENPKNSFLNRGMDLGGMGLINTLTRMHLFYEGLFQWEIVRNEKGDVLIILNGPLFKDFEKDSHV